VSNEYTREQVIGDLVNTGYRVAEDIIPFLMNFKEEKSPAWILFQHYADMYRAQGIQRSAVYILDDVRHHHEKDDEFQLPNRKPVKVPNDWAPYFAGMYNGKRGCKYFKINKKGQKGNPDFYKEVA